MEKINLEVTKIDGSVENRIIELIPDPSLIPSRKHTLRQMIVECIIEEDPILDDARKVEFKMPYEISDEPIVVKMIRGQ